MQSCPVSYDESLSGENHLEWIAMLVSASYWLIIVDLTMGLFCCLFVFLFIKNIIMVCVLIYYFIFLYPFLIYRSGQISEGPFLRGILDSENPL